jgi:hypothetical protein
MDKKPTIYLWRVIYEHYYNGSSGRDSYTKEYTTGPVYILTVDESIDSIRDEIARGFGLNTGNVLGEIKEAVYLGRIHNNPRSC